jgi:hypothetical protein
MYLTRDQPVARPLPTQDSTVRINDNIRIRDPNVRASQDYYNVAPCSLVEVCRRFRGACCLDDAVDDDYNDVSRRNGML